MLGRSSKGAELTLAAAIRDAGSDKPEIRNVAIRSLAPALLDELGERPPVWWDRIEHEQRELVAELLDRACEDPAPQNAGLARVGLAELAAPTALPRSLEALANPHEDSAAMFQRECAVIGLSLIGAAARTWLDDPASAGAGRRERADELLGRVMNELRGHLDDERDDVRFQVGPALVEVGGAGVEAELLAALEREDHPRVRENLIAALSMLDPPSPAACDVLAAVLESGEAEGPVGWEAAMALTAARRPEGAARLVAGLRSRATRDRALEALAVLGPTAVIGSGEAADAVRRLTRGVWVPAFTKVRAAYALARIAPAEGRALLDKLARHPRPAVREAVEEARQNLARLADEGDSARRSAYRRE